MFSRGVSGVFCPAASLLLSHSFLRICSFVAPRGRAKSTHETTSTPSLGKKIAAPLGAAVIATLNHITGLILHGARFREMG